MIKFGLIPEAAASYTLSIRAHGGMAEDLLYTGRKAMAHELSPKIIQRVWPDKEFHVKLKELLNEMREHNPRSMLEAKRLLRNNGQREKVQNAVIYETVRLA